MIWMMSQKFDQGLELEWRGFIGASVMPQAKAKMDFWFMMKKHDETGGGRKS